MYRFRKDEHLLYTVYYDFHYNINTLKSKVNIYVLDKLKLHTGGGGENVSSKII